VVLEVGSLFINVDFDMVNISCTTGFIRSNSIVTVVSSNSSTSHEWKLLLEVIVYCELLYKAV
jgi:hypothetical protein